MSNPLYTMASGGPHGPEVIAEAKAVLALPMEDNDAEAATVGEYLAGLLVGVLVEEEGFDGKRPFGNSGWIGDLCQALAAGGRVAPSDVDEWMWYERVLTGAAHLALTEPVL